MGVAWFDADGKHVKAAPSHIKKAFGKEVRSVAALGKELEQAYLGQRTRLEASFLPLPGTCRSRTGGNILLSILCSDFSAAG